LRSKESGLRSKESGAQQNSSEPLESGGKLNDARLGSEGTAGSGAKHSGCAAKTAARAN
jgi:hypothetical protein